MRKPLLLAVVLLMPLALEPDARANDELDVGQEPPTVLVQAGHPRFEPLATEVAAEIRSLLQPEAKPWRVLHATDAGSLEASAATASIVVAVGVRPDTTPPAVASKTPLHLLVDAVGWLESPDSENSSPHRRIAAAGLKAVAAADLAAFRHLLEQIHGPRADPPRILVPLDDWLQPAGSMLRQAGDAARVRVELLSLDQVTDGTSQVYDADGLYLPPGHGLYVPDVVSAVHARGIPTFSAHGRKEVTAGVLAARGLIEADRLPRLTALQVLARVRDLPPVGLIARPTTEDGSEVPLVLRPAAADALGLELPWRLELSVEFLGQRQRKASPIHLEAAVDEALTANLGLRARTLATAASEEEVLRALAALRPRLSLSSQARSLDRDSAIAAFGAQPERLATAIGEASWILFSEEARAGVDVAQRLQTARELELRELKRDIALESALTLLEVARTRAFEAVERENLSLTYAELAAARARRTAGSGSRADVARLRARISRDRQALVAAYGDRRGAELRFNRLLRRPLEGPVQPALDVSEDADSDTIGLPFEDLVRTPAAFIALRHELLSIAEAQAPEIAAADKVIEARERQLLAARRAFYLPTARATARLETRLAEGGVGRDAPGIPGDPGLFPLPPDTAWSLGVGLELPLLTGGTRAARQATAELELEAAEILREQAQQRVEERLRLALVGLETTYETRLQAQRAAEAAQEAFEVVEDGYTQGTESLTTLLDAQTELRVARRSRAAATYAALGRWHEVQRATGGPLDDATQHRLQATALNPSREEER